MRKSSVLAHVKFITFGAMLAAMSIIIGIFCKSYLNFANGLLRITFENLPIILSGILFGPIIGGLVGVVSDLVSYLLTAQGYPPNLIVTLGAFLVGVISGIIPRFVVKKRGTLQIVLAGGIAHIVGSMIVKPIGLYQFYGWLVLVRIPLYLVIAPIEIILLCQLFKRKSFCKFIDFMERY